MADPVELEALIIIVKAFQDVISASSTAESAVEFLLKHPGFEKQADNQINNLTCIVE